MKRFIPYIAFACLSGLTAANTIPVIAGGCSSHMNKSAKIECSIDDIECQKEEAENFRLKKTVKS